MSAWTRRTALCCGAAAIGAGLFTALGAETAPSLRQGFAHPCLGPTPQALAEHPLVRAAFEGIDAGALWDVHAHLLGTGDSGSGCRIDPRMLSPRHPVEWLRRKVILDAACVPANAASMDIAYVDRLRRLAADFPPGARWLLFAFDAAFGDDGRERPDWTGFHVPDAYAARVAAADPARFGWVASVHPYRPDALERLEAARAGGALAVKWLPSSMNIDLRDRRCRPFFDRLAATRMPLVVHVGEERAIPGAGRGALGNPLQLRIPLGAGVRVIAAHAATLGEAVDTDRRSAAPSAAFDLFARLMDEAAWRELLLADISAAFQSNRRLRVQRALLRRDDWHARLLHGSDHPLPGVMPLYAPERLARAGLLDAADVAPLKRLRAHNPLLFEFVLKRTLRDGSARLPAIVFESRRHFEPALATVRATA